MAKPLIGRPPIITPEKVSKLEEVFAIGGSDLEACAYADIAKTTLYNYQAKHPEFVARKDMLRERPFLKARQTIVKALDNPADAQWYMERKRKVEFGSSPLISQETSVNINFTVLDGGRYQHPLSPPEAGRDLIPPGEIQGDGRWKEIREDGRLA